MILRMVALVMFIASFFSKTHGWDIVITAWLMVIAADTWDIRERVRA